jgi:hypothetical protein
MGVWRAAIASVLMLGAAASAVAQQRPQRHNVTQEERQAARAALDAFTSPTLTRFQDQSEFRRYIAAVRAEERTQGDYYYTYSAAEPESLRFAQSVVPGQATVQSDATAQRCIPTPDHPCTDEESGNESVVVTGSRVAPPRNPSITNNQMRNVEEGDIIKQIDHYLLILQDGRIFVIDMNAGGTARQPGQALRLTDRANVYRYASADSAYETWYDEMLVSGDRILVTGYSYDAQASELAVFRLDTNTGRLRREGVFRIASNDYYSSNGYATRLIGDALAVYTPFRISDIDDEEFTWPRVRPWTAEDDVREQAWLERRGRDWQVRREPLPDVGSPLLGDSDIYRPVERAEEPTVHTVSVCPLASVGRGALSCRSTAVVGPDVREWYVTADHAYLWTGEEGRHCENQWRGQTVAIARARRALAYRIPLTGAPPAVIAARGTPPDQFALQADARNLYALVRLEPAECANGYRYYDPASLAFVTLPQSAFGPALAELALDRFVALPGTPTTQVAARFTERYLVYGGLSGYRRGLPDPNEFFRYHRTGYEPDDEYAARQFVGMRASPAVVVPIAHPDRPRTLATGHTMIRADRLGDDIILTGYRDRDGLSVTLIDLDSAPRIASSVQLAGRYESEGRSHAFNSRIDPDGNSLMGLPTVPQVKDSEREVWRSRASDLSFLTADRMGRLRLAGDLLRRFDYVDRYDDSVETEDPDGVPGYQCEVSCTDWYGNSRPVFTDGRIFGLSGTELIEGRMFAGRIREVRRLNIALSPVPAR